MATVAQQVVFHPAVSETLKVWGTTVGRDKARISLRCSGPETSDTPSLCVSRPTVLCNTLHDSLHGSCSPGVKRSMQRDGLRSRTILPWVESVRWVTILSYDSLTKYSLVMRLGKPMEHLQAALKAASASGPAAEQLTTIGRQLGYFGYLTNDALVWVRACEPELPTVSLM